MRSRGAKRGIHPPMSRSNIRAAKELILNLALVAVVFRLRLIGYGGTNRMPATTSIIGIDFGQSDANQPETNMDAVCRSGGGCWQVPCFPMAVEVPCRASEFRLLSGGTPPQRHGRRHTR